MSADFRPTRVLKSLMLATDIGLILYWSVTALHVLPEAWLYSDYHNPKVVAWNWSFMPLDLIVAATGLRGLWLYRMNNPTWQNWVLVSLTLTVASGLQAISYWFFTREFDPAWWLPNLFLLLYPLFFIRRLLCAVV